MSLEYCVTFVNAATMSDAYHSHVRAEHPVEAAMVAMHQATEDGVGLEGCAAKVQCVIPIEGTELQAKAAAEFREAIQAGAAPVIARAKGCH